MGEGFTLGEWEEASETYEGFLGFTVPTPVLPVHSTFGCEVTIQVTAVANSAMVTQLSPTTSTCAGTGVFLGCKLANDSSNPPWEIDFGGIYPVITGPVEMTSIYESCPFASLGFTYNELSVVPYLRSGSITKLVISGKNTSGTVTLSGSLIHEGTESLGLE
jgi:hypothetical protein